jgi:hypothetical protein
MKRIIYFLLTVLVSALYSCSGQYDNIEQYATDETVYIGKFIEDPYVKTGYKRLEIDLVSDTLGRAFADDIYMGKAKKTIVEYEEDDGLRRLVYDSLCSWVNIKGLTTPKTYIFTIYAEDEFGNKSIPVEALGKPFTDNDMEGISFPSPHVIPGPTTVSFDWESAVSEGLSSPQFKFVELIYSYTDRYGNILSGKLTAQDERAGRGNFDIRNLAPNKGTAVIINCRIIPIIESGTILDTLPMVKEYVTQTVTEEEYLKARTLRSIETALINPDDENTATITFGAQTDHLKWTKIRYKNNDGNWQEIHVENYETVKSCPNFERRGMVQIQCAYTPPSTNDVLISEWTDYGPFILKHDPRREGWTVIPRTGWLQDWTDGTGSQGYWDGGHPMLIFDNDIESGWHTPDGAELPQVLVIDMKGRRRVSKVLANNNSYISTIQLYLTDNPSITGYSEYTITNWDNSYLRESYKNWVTPYMSQIPASPPASWGEVIGQVNVAGEGAFSINLPEVLEGRFLIIRFPDSFNNWGGPPICIKNLEVYSD